MIKKYNEFISEEAGIRNIKDTIKGYKNAEIYFHKDLDGVTSAIAMKVYLKTYYNIDTIDCHTIQYGGLEYAIKNVRKGNLAVLVDFAHGKPMFHIQTDHHDNQVGDNSTKSKHFKHTRSNAETLSSEIPPSDIFTHGDVELIKTVDSADFLKHNLTVDDIQNSIFKLNKDLDADKNRFLMGLVTNRLILAYKNKRITVDSLDGKYKHSNRNILECLVLDSNASLISMFNNIRHYIKLAKVNDKLGKLATVDDISRNLKSYVNRMKNYKFIDSGHGFVDEYDEDDYRHKLKLRKGEARIGNGINYEADYKIINQYGGGNMIMPGSYDRYTAFKNNIDADFFIMVWPMGLIQVSCNPFKEKSMKDINLGEISKEVLSKYENTFRKFYVSILDIKKEYELTNDWRQMSRNDKDYQGVGFKYTDLEAFYKDCLYTLSNGKVINKDINDGMIENYMNKLYNNLDSNERDYLSGIKIPIWEIIVRNSGGHPSITNITGFSLLKYNLPALKKAFDTNDYSKVLKLVARDFNLLLKQNIDTINKGDVIKYNSNDVKLGASITEL